MHKQQTTPGMPTTGNPIKVEVHAWLDRDTHKVKFTDEWESGWTNGKQKGEIVVPAKTPATEIHFHLRDDTGLGLNFMRNFADVMYVSTGATCPPPRGNQGGQISFVHSSPNLLKVTNANCGNPIDLKYALRFNGQDNLPGGENQPYVYDPDLKNGGGGVGGINNNNTAYLLIGGAVLAGLAYLTYTLFFD